MKTTMFRSVLGVIFLMLIITPFVSDCSWAAGEKYPSGPIDIFCGYGPGGPNDITTRALGRGLEKYLGVTVVPGNKPGGSSVIAATALAGSRPDGYTMAVLNPDAYLVPIIQGRAAYALEDLLVVGQFAKIPATLSVRADAPWKTFQELLDYTRKNPGVKYAHPGVGGPTFFRMENLNRFAKLNMVGVPFKSDPEIVSAILGGHVPVGVSTLTGFKPQADAGQIRILFSFEPPALTGLDPSVADLRAVFGDSVRDIDIPICLVVPAKTPKEIVEVLAGALEKVAKDPVFVSDVKKIYMMPDLFVDGKIIMQRLPERMQQLKKMMQDLGLLK
jgi:tripartite-type tricarboxylate transporter receptor subunit TctC